MGVLVLVYSRGSLLGVGAALWLIALLRWPRAWSVLGIAGWGDDGHIYLGQPMAVV